MNHLNHFLVQQQYEVVVNNHFITGPAAQFYQSELYWQNSLHPIMSSASSKVSAKAYYGEYHGHRIKDLEPILVALREKSSRLIWTAGDSSLDNKYWVEEEATAVGAYKYVLQPPRSIQDVTFWLNYHCQQSKNRKSTAAINAAVEATTLNERTFQLRPQDYFIRDNLQANDILIVSIGGNDIAMKPCPCTIASMGAIVCMPQQILEKGFTFGYCPFQDYCCGCGPSCWSCACSCPPCLGYFRHLFQIRVQYYLEALTSKTKPAKILICMIYYPDETNTGGWASWALNFLGYDKDPEKIQLLIRKAYHEATSMIRIPGVEVIPVPLYNALNGKDTTDYVARVEPSAKGGTKMAEFLLDIIDNPPVTPSMSPPTSSQMQDRE
ncbi:hypothetical protein FisN_6Lh148 [Fistulifera solaris]|uniref:Uncharacterized protein n=1 Tax=Fistulifera solaris TaxID=1519565 RepID=A0A1Z5J648_FISSO|nr:hypothetical protein FisN_6Lh148 [Fistulifera solaris]|eukprot:GAX09473.1 hypothetical protein FisN_6Lh148 [Fistulifera solaris]